MPLFLGTTGSLAAFYAMAERAQGRRARDAIVLVPAIIAVGVGLAPLVTRALFRGLRSMAGEFVRTPKKGSTTGARYRSTTVVVPAAETVLSAVALVSTIASVHTGYPRRDAVRGALHQWLRVHGRRDGARADAAGDRGARRGAVVSGHVNVRRRIAATHPQALVRRLAGALRPRRSYRADRRARRCLALAQKKTSSSSLSP